MMDAAPQDKDDPEHTTSRALCGVADRAGTAGRRVPESCHSFPLVSRLSTKLLAAYIAVVVVALLLVAPPLHVYFRRNHVSRAAERFESELRLVATELAAAAERGDSEALDALCEHLNRGYEGRVSMIGADGKVLADSLGALCAARARPECRAIVQQTRALLYERDMPMRDTVTIRLPVALGSSGQATVRLALPLSPVQSQLQYLYRLLLAGALAAMAVAVVIGLFLARRIARPLEQMTEAAEHISAGDFGHDLPPGGRDEIGRLATSLDSMRKSLKHNMTALQDERNQALAIVRNMSDGVVALDHEHRVVFANTAAAAMLEIPRGLDVGVDVAGLPIADRLAEGIREVMRSRQAVAIELGEVTAGDRIVRVSISAVNAEDGAGEGYPGVVLVLRDMTEARRAERLGRELVANASHELRTPLAVIASTADTLLASDRNTDATQREFLEMILRHARHMEELVSETLQLSLLESGSPAGDWEELDAAALVRQIHGLFASAANLKGVRLETPPDQPVPPVQGIESLLLQALGNLTDNAIRFSPAGGTVNLTVGRTIDMIEFHVKDAGPGIAAADRERIFERFVRLPQHTGQDMSGGAGMGLAIVRQVARIHGGRIAVKSTPGKGSRFILSIPLASSRSSHTHSGQRPGA